jgi:hypothetical protein
VLWAYNNLGLPVALTEVTLAFESEKGEDGLMAETLSRVNLEPQSTTKVLCMLFNAAHTLLTILVDRSPCQKCSGGQILAEDCSLPIQRHDEVHRKPTLQRASPERHQSATN